MEKKTCWKDQELVSVIGGNPVKAGPLERGSTVSGYTFALDSDYEIFLFPKMRIYKNILNLVWALRNPIGLQKYLNSHFHMAFIFVKVGVFVTYVSLLFSLVFVSYVAIFSSLQKPDSSALTLSCHVEMKGSNRNSLVRPSMRRIIQT